MECVLLPGFFLIGPSALLHEKAAVWQPIFKREYFTHGRHRGSISDSSWAVKEIGFGINNKETIIYMNALCRPLRWSKATGERWWRNTLCLNGLATSGANELGNYSWWVGGAEPGWERSSGCWEPQHWHNRQQSTQSLHNNQSQVSGL